MQKGDPRAVEGGRRGAEVRRWTQANRRWTVELFLLTRPSLSTDEIAERLGVNRSTIRRDRAALRAVARVQSDEGDKEVEGGGDQHDSAFAAAIPAVAAASGIAARSSSPHAQPIRRRR